MPTERTVILSDADERRLNEIMTAHNWPADRAISAVLRVFSDIELRLAAGAQLYVQVPGENTRMLYWIV